LALLVLIVASAGGTGQLDDAQAAGTQATFGKTTVGSSSTSFPANQKQVNRYALSTAGSVTKLTVYMMPTATAGQQLLKGVVYADANGTPGSLLGVSQQLAFTSTNVAGWYDLGFSSPVKLAAGNYWIGVITGATAKVAAFRWDKVKASRATNANKYTAGPSNPFGTATVAAQQTSLYATYTPSPVNTATPTITGTPQQGQTLTEHHGAWTNEPSSYSYQWLQCDTLGGGCLPIAGAISETYVLSAADVGHAIRVQETASNLGGSSVPATSAPTQSIATAAPENRTAPTIAGTARFGQRLTTSNGTWTNEPTEYAYQWQRCDANGANCSPISGETTQSYTVASADVGARIEVAVTASNAGGRSAAVSSAPTELATCLRQSPYSGVVSSTPGLVSYWRLGESSGTVACDSAGHNNGTYLGGAALGTSGAISGDPDTAASFNGSSSQVSVPAAGSLNVGDTFSIEGWVKRADSSIGSNQAIVSKQEGSWVLMFNESGQLTLRRSTVADVATATVVTTDTSSWHYVVATKTGPSVHLYLDGMDVTGPVSNQTMVDNNQPLAIGQSTGTAYLNGSVDEVALYNSVLTPAQVAEHYSAGINAPLAPRALTATPGNTTVTLNWSASPGRAVSGYKVYRANADGSWPSTPLATVSASTLSYTDASVVNGSTYTYRVTSYDGTGNESSPSNQASAAVGCSPRQSPYSGVVSSTPGLVSYWRLGESSGTVACDSAGHNNGTYLGGAALGTSGAISGDPDTAASFNGSSSQVSVPAAGSLNVGDTFSIEGWVKRADSSIGSNQAIVSKQEGSWVLMFNESGQLTLRRSTVADVATATVVTTDTSSWHYVVATKTGPSVHLYLDGMDVTGPVSNQTMVDNNQPLAIGQSTGTAYLNGSVDEVALYNSVLTPAQVAEHYSAGINASHDPVLAAVGDIACAPGDTTDDCQQLATANLVSAQKPSAVAVLGDNQYQSGLLSEYDGAGAYNDTWGQFNSIVHPTPGNAEYAATTTASGYFTYFGSSAGNGNYSYDVGAWHIISLNSNCSDTGCQASEAGTTSSSTVSWLEGDLAAHQNQCILAYWHHPRFSSGFVGSSPGVAPFWNALYAARADVVLNGHDHLYERFAQQDPAQTATGDGIREFVVGTGGQEHDPSMGSLEPNMQVADIHDYGVLFLTLHPSSYDWAFRATNGAVLDSGSTPCHA
jgi:acid phosphatase type 7